MLLHLKQSADFNKKVDKIGNIANFTIKYILKKNRKKYILGIKDNACKAS